MFIGDSHQVLWLATKGAFYCHCRRHKHALNGGSVVSGSVMKAWMLERQGYDQAGKLQHLMVRARKEGVGTNWRRSAKSALMRTEQSMRAVASSAEGKEGYAWSRAYIQCGVGIARDLEAKESFKGQRHFFQILRSRVEARRRARRMIYLRTVISSSNRLSRSQSLVAAHRISIKLTNGLTI